MATRINLLEWIKTKFNTKEEISDLLDDKLDVEHNSDNNAHSNILSTVAKTGSYNDLSNTPTIDSSLSTSSTNPLQNKVVTNALNDKSNTNHTHSWITQSLGSYGTLYVNETLRLVIFHYSRSYNYPSASDMTLETGIIPSDYRPSKSVPCGTASPYVAGRVTSDGSLRVVPTIAGTLGTTVQAIWVY